MGLRDEIREQPAAATRQLESSEGALEAIAARVRGEGITSVVIAARGTSGSCAHFRAPRWTISAKIADSMISVSFQLT